MLRSIHLCFLSFQCVEGPFEYIGLAKIPCFLILRWLIFRSRSELAAAKVLKKFKHQSGDFIFSKTSTWRSSALEQLMLPVNAERNVIHSKMESEQLVEGYFLQYNNLWFNFEMQYLKLINLELYQIIEPFRHGKMHCQYVLVALIRAGANLILKILWKLIVDKKKEHLDAQYNALPENTE